MDENRRDEIIAEARRHRKKREQGYREQALKMFPWICARCGREFTGKKVRELTVHHKDHNHDYNPADGSNWELLCLYCHENEHARMDVADAYHAASSRDEEDATSGYQPFAGLDALLKGEEKKDGKNQ